MWRWRDAESRLYSLVVADPDLYRLALTVVVEAREVLRRTCADLSALLVCDPAAALAQCPTAPALRDYGFDAAVAVDAARAQRLRELS